MFPWKSSASYLKIRARKLRFALAGLGAMVLPFSGWGEAARFDLTGSDVVVTLTLPKAEQVKPRKIAVA